MKECAAVLLLLFMSGTVHGHIALGDGIERSTPALAIILAITARYVLELYVRWHDFAHGCTARANTKTAPDGSRTDGEGGAMAREVTTASGTDEKKKD